MAKNASRKHKPAAALKKARVISSKKAYVGPVFWVTTDHVLEPTGVRVRRDVVQHSGSVVVLAVDDQRPETASSAGKTVPPRRPTFLVRATRRAH